MCRFPVEAIKVTAQVPGMSRVASEIESPDGLGDEEIYSERGSTAAAAKGVATTVRDMWITSAVKMGLLADDPRRPSRDG